jgi:hypothetical protein
MRYLPIVIISFLAWTQAHSQSTSTVRTDSSIKNQPVICHDKSSVLPNTLHIVGTIEGGSGGMWSYVYFKGTVLIRLDKIIRGYPYLYVYAVIETPFNPTIGKHVEVNAYRYICGAHNIFNVLDSKGVPFYELTEIASRQLN